MLWFFFKLQFFLWSIQIDSICNFFFNQFFFFNRCLGSSSTQFAVFFLEKQGEQGARSASENPDVCILGSKKWRWHKQKTKIHWFLNLGLIFVWLPKNGSSAHKSHWIFIYALWPLIPVGSLDFSNMRFSTLSDNPIWNLWQVSRPFTFKIYVGEVYLHLTLFG